MYNLQRLECMQQRSQGERSVWKLSRWIRPREGHTLPYIYT